MFNFKQFRASKWGFNLPVVGGTSQSTSNLYPKNGLMFSNLQLFVDYVNNYSGLKAGVSTQNTSDEF